jgi:hypothetical protein
MISRTRNLTPLQLEEFFKLAEKSDKAYHRLNSHHNSLDSNGKSLIRTNKTQPSSNLPLKNEGSFIFTISDNEYLDCMEFLQAEYDGCIKTLGSLNKMLTEYSKKIQ